LGAVESRVSAIVIARDEEERIGACLTSLSWVDEQIVVVDARSSDRTEAISRPLATEVIVRAWEGFAETKRFAVSRARHPWILWCDADEEVSHALADSIQKAVRSPGEAVGFRVRRRNTYMGSVVRHGAWSGDRVLRLFRKDRGHFDDRLIHESVVLDGPASDLEGFLEHRSYRDLTHHWGKIANWSGLWAEQQVKRRRRASPLDVIARPPLRFFKGFVLKRGFLDGRAGLVLAFMDAAYVGMKYARLLEIQESIRQIEQPENMEGR
jgi:glycosyltransferase involved in cell wall biosynthesis